MKPRLRPIKHLYHRFGVHTGLDAIDVARALELKGLIDMIPTDGETLLYRETDLMRELPADTYTDTILACLEAYKRGNL